MKVRTEKTRNLQFRIVLCSIKQHEPLAPCSFIESSICVFRNQRYAFIKSVSFHSNTDLLRVRPLADIRQNKNICFMTIIVIFMYTLTEKVHYLT